MRGFQPVKSGAWGTPQIPKDAGANKLNSKADTSAPLVQWLVLPVLFESATTPCSILLNTCAPSIRYFRSEAVLIYRFCLKLYSQTRCPHDLAFGADEESLTINSPSNRIFVLEAVPARIFSRLSIAILPICSLG